MKWNWGLGLLVSMLCFIGFIMFFVITMTTNRDYDHDLVEEDYYTKEVHYQKEIDAEKKTKSFNKPIIGQKTPYGWEIKFPEDLDALNLEGTVAFYRPSNQLLDFQLPLTVTKSLFIVPDSTLLNGRWNINITFTYKGENYLYKDKIMY